MELKIGDAIFIRLPYHGIVRHIIRRITPTLYVSDKGIKFKKEGLRILGARRGGPYAGQLPTPKLLLEWRMQEAQIKLVGSP